MSLPLRIGAALAMSSVAFAQCNHDNLYRCLTGSSAVAVPFCSSYISIPENTVTVVSTAPTPVVTATITVATSTVTDYVTAAAKLRARDLGERAVLVKAPACLSSGSTTAYAASRISSACSCLSIKPSTTSITTVQSPATSTEFVSVTAVTTTTKTIVSSSTTTSAACTPSSPVDDGSTEYASYYTGANFTETDNNPGNQLPDVFPPETTTFPGTQTPCQAVQNCADFTFSQPDIYYSFALYLFGTENEWQCVSYWNSNTNASYFNVANDDVELAYGYSLQDIDN